MASDPGSGRVRPLSELIADLEARALFRTFIPGGEAAPARLPIAAVVSDSRRVAPGSLFVTVVGERGDGHDYAYQAVERGAVAVLVERPLPGLAVPQILVVGARPALAVAAAWLEGYPSRSLTVVGVTGTDGKTTTCHLVRAVLEAAGQRTGLLTTSQLVVGGRAAANPTRSTTPEAPELQRQIARMRDAGDRCAVIESTSHGLALDRVAEVAYDVAVLTNVTHEHLEFHRSIEAYRAAKMRLFELLKPGVGNPDKGWPKTGVVNLDDPVAHLFTETIEEAGGRQIGYGTSQDADVRASRIEQDASGLRLAVTTPRWQGPLALRLTGRFNAHNALAAVAVGEALDLDPDRVREGLESFTGLTGRMERIEAGQPFTVIVDYAHTPDALSKVLDELAPLAAARGGGLVAVFGSAGERDVLKRPMMGRVAAERCRLVVLTDEDARGEDPLAILGQIAAGAERAGGRRGQDLLLIPDRRAAIGTALDAARPGDVVLLAGKGHERTIETAAGALPWDEAVVAREALAGLGYGGR